jgi:hypothetical protein
MFPGQVRGPALNIAIALAVAVGWGTHHPTVEAAPSFGEISLVPTISGSGCVRGDIQADFACVKSKNYPNDYGDDEACSVTLPNAQSVYAIDVIDFNTESGYDLLSVNGVAYSGSSGYGLHGQEANQLDWRTDGSVTRSGWKICFRLVLSVSGSQDARLRTHEVPGA